MRLIPLSLLLFGCECEVRIESVSQVVCESLRLLISLGDTRFIGVIAPDLGEE